MVSKRIALQWSICLAVIFAFLTISAYAQFGSSVRGTIEDTSGAVIPNAKVTLKNTGTGASKVVTSNASGFYQFSELAPGTYSLSVEASGFKNAALSSVAVAAETPRDVDVKLEVGGSSESVTVSGNDVSALQTADASIGSTISSEQVTRLPAFGRDPYELLRTSVGITGDGARSGSGGGVYLPNAQGPGQSNYGVFQTENQIQISSAGQRVTSNSYLIDGVSVDSLLHGGSAIITPNMESVSQLSVTSTSYDAQDGRNVGALIKTVTKSGTNQYHGSLFFQYDEPGLNAYQSYGGPQGALAQRVENKQREWAGSIGGPIFKDKLFWFGSYEGVKNSDQTFSEQYVVSPQFLSYLSANRGSGVVASILNGLGGKPNVVKYLPIDCNNVQPSYDGAATDDNCLVVNGGANTGAFGGAVGTYTNQTGAATADNTATFDGIPDISFAQVSTPASFRGNQFNGRVDWNITQRDLLAVTAFFSKLDQTSGDASTGGQPISNIPFKPFNSSGTLVYIHTFTPSLVNEVRANYTRFADNQIADSKGTVNWGVPRFEVQGYNFGRLYSGATDSPDSPGIFAENTYEFRDTVIKTVGNHTLRLGLQYRIEQDNDNLAGEARPDYVFQGVFNYANDAPIFEQIAANPDTGGVANAQRYFRDHDIAAFVQHDWKVNPNLTVNTGMRYEYMEPLYNKGLGINQPVFGSDSSTYLINARLAPVNHIYNGNFNNWAPKLGFAYTPPVLKNKMVVRGGFGVSYDRIDDILFLNGYENGPGYFVFGLCCGTDTASAQAAHIQFGLGSSDSPFSYPANSGLATGVNPTTGIPNQAGEIEIYGASKRTPQPILYSFSFETQYELPYQMLGTVGYQGSIGHHFPRLVDQNFLHPTASGTCLTGGTCTSGVNQTPFYAAYIPTTDVFTNYNGLNLHLTKRFSHGYNIDAVYAYSKSMDQGSNEGPGAESNQTDPAHPATEYGPSDFDVRHRFTLSGLWDLPKYHGGKGLVGQVASGWQLNGIYTYHTGFPWTPVTGVPSVAVVQSAATIAPTRPLAYLGGAGNNCSNGAYIHGTNFSGGGTKYFEIGKSGPPGIGRNSWNGPCYMDTDISAAKEQTFSALGHEAQVRFQANFYNIFNKTNLTPITLGSPEGLIENSLFGLAPNADAGRVLEFFARVQF